MLMKKYNVQWTPGVNETQSVYLKLDDAGFSLVASDIVSTVVDYIISVPATTLKAQVVISSDAKGQTSVSSEPFSFDVADVVPPIVLTAATGISVTLIGEENV